MNYYKGKECMVFGCHNPAAHDVGGNGDTIYMCDFHYNEGRKEKECEFIYSKNKKICQCSNCAYNFNVIEAEWNYCPVCGAKRRNNVRR